MLLKKILFSNEEIIDAINSGGSIENTVLKFIYTEVKRPLLKFIKNNSGNKDDAEDIIQDAIIVFYEKVKQDNFKLHTTVIGYIYTVGKYMWHNKLRKSKGQVLLEDYNLSTIDVDQYDLELFHYNETSFVNEILKKIGNACQAILKQSLYQKLQMVEIAKLNGYKNEQIARNKKSKCLKELRKVIENSKRYKTILKELRYE